MVVGLLYAFERQLLAAKYKVISFTAVLRVSLLLSLWPVLHRRRGIVYFAAANLW
jgi:hypothetical protein